MKIVKVIGGLGNQMFQFALYKALQRQFPQERVLLDLHCFNGYHKHRGFEIGTVFHANYEEASLKDVARLAYPYPNFLSWRIGSRILPVRKSMLKEKADFTFEPSATTRQTDTYYDGYWQHEEYFKDIREELLSVYTFPPFEDERNQQTAHLVTTNNSCSLHIRRGDYLTDPLRKGTTGSGFAIEAIHRMKALEQPDTWCVFSDDIPWCRQHLAGILDEGSTCYVDWNKDERSIQDMHLMSLCHHQIIANSSFSWWGAWLNQNPDKTVIGPDKWMNLPHVASPMPEGWLRLSPTKEQAI